MSNTLKVKSYISLDFSPLYYSRPKVFAKQGDENSRYVVVTPLLGGMPYDIDQTGAVSPRFAARKPDGKFIYNDKVEIRDDGSLLVELTDQTLVTDGEVVCCIVLIDDSKGITLSSQNFIIDVEFCAGAYEELVSSDEIMNFKELVELSQKQLASIDEELALVEKRTEEKLSAADAAIAEWKKGADAELDAAAAAWKKDADAELDAAVTEWEKTLQLHLTEADAKVDEKIAEWDADARSVINDLEVVYNALAALFPVTSPEDDGKIPMVVNGVWQAVRLADLSKEGK